MPGKSEEWIPCKTPEVGDMLRWDEPLFAPPSKARGKPNKVGDQRVTAELLAVGEVYVLDVHEVTKTGGSGLVRMRTGEQIRRKASSIAIGNCFKKRV